MTNARPQEWKNTPTGWTCDDESDLEFALIATFLGFDLVAFDQWLTTLPPGQHRDELLWRRSRAKAADVNNDDMRIMCEGLKAEQHMRLWARKGVAEHRRQSHGGIKAGAALSVSAKTADAALLRAARSILVTDPRIQRVALAAMLADRGLGGAEAIRKKLPRLLGKKSREEN